ncbi:transposase, partial [Gordonia otitidis]|uniref:transposase n=1 Tax=Gordonia otitidis TaxID=249058 RepID=UPI003C6D8F4C
HPQAIDREVLGMQVATSETKASWNTFFADLVARGLGGVCRGGVGDGEGAGPGVETCAPQCARPGCGVSRGRGWMSSVRDARLGRGHRPLRCARRQRRCARTSADSRWTRPRPGAERSAAMACIDAARSCARTASSCR